MVIIMKGSEKGVFAFEMIRSPRKRQDVSSKIHTHVKWWQLFLRLFNYSIHDFNSI